MTRREFATLAVGAVAATAAGVSPTQPAGWPRAFPEGTEAVFNPKLPTVLPGFPGTPRLEGRFVNLHSDERPTFSNILSWTFSRNPQKAEKDADSERPAFHAGFPDPDRSRDTLVWLGHATLLIQMGGLRLLVDPVLDYPMSKRYSQSPCDFAKLAGVDYLLISHGHFDHLDLDVISRLPSGIRALVPLGMSELIQDSNPGLLVEEAGWWQRFTTPANLGVTFVPSQHWYRRTPFDNNRVLWGGFHIQSEGRSLYFPGDTAYCPHFREIRNHFGPVDICVLPVGAYKPPSVMKPSHTSPDEAVQAFRDLNGKVFVPVHWGTFDLSDEPPGEPLRRLKELESQGQIPGHLEILGIGNSLDLEVAVAGLP